MDRKPTTRARLAAALALALAALTAAAAVYAVIANFPRGLILAALLIGSAIAAWYGLLRRDAARIAGLGAAAALVLAAALIVVLDEGLLELVLVGTGALATIAATKTAFAVRRALEPARDPARPVLFFNPRSGGGKAERFGLADEARARGYRPVELTPGSDLEQLVRGAIAEGVDALAGGGEKRVDLAEVNGRVFVNNVSLGLYAEAVQREGYREAKLRTILDTLPDVVGSEGNGLNLRWTGPGGTEHSSGAAILVSNNRYRLGRAVGSGTRPRIDDGLLGITVAGAPAGRGDGGRRPQRPWREWTAPTFEVRADGPIAAGIDGEALVLKSPLRFAIRPGVLRARVARAHPGASPAAAMPDSFAGTVRATLAIATGRRVL